MRKPWLLIAIYLAAIVLVACGSETETATVSPTPAQPAPTQVPAPAEVLTTAPAGAPTLAPTATASPTATPAPPAIPVEQQITGQVVEATDRNPVEIELLQVLDNDGRLWEFVTEGPIGIDAAHLRFHRETRQKVEVIFLDKGGRLVALQVNDVLNR